MPAAPAMDWPEAWRFIREEHPDPAEHHPSCSWVQTNGALLCDCDVLWDEYVRRGGSDPRVAAEEARRTPKTAESSSPDSAVPAAVEPGSETTDKTPEVEPNG